MPTWAGLLWAASPGFRKPASPQGGPLLFAFVNTRPTKQQGVDQCSLHGLLVPWSGGAAFMISIFFLFFNDWVFYSLWLQAGFSKLGLGITRPTQPCSLQSSFHHRVQLKVKPFSFLWACTSCEPHWSGVCVLKHPRAGLEKGSHGDTAFCSTSLSFDCAWPPVLSSQVGSGAGRPWLHRDLAQPYVPTRPDCRSRDLPIRLQHRCSSAVTQESPQEQKSYRLLPNETVGVHCIMMFLKIILLLQDKYHDHFLLVMIALSLS